MKKQEFLEALKKGLSGLPREDVAERLSFYSEMIDDYMEEGATEAEAVARIGPVNEVVAQCSEKKNKPRRKLKIWEWVLLIAGSPIWIALLAAAAAIVVSLYAVLWCAIVVLWALEGSLMGSVLGGIIMSAVAFLSGNPPVGWAMMGIAVFCVGAAIFLLHGCKTASKGAW